LREKWPRRFRDLIIEHVNDLGGPDAVSASERALVKRACTLITELEMMEERFALSGGASPDELEIYQRCANSMRRLLESVGLQRRARDITAPADLQSYIRSRNGEREAAQ
jgi:hypothetical protein